MLQQDIFDSGRLLLPDEPVQPVVAEPVESLVGTILVVVSVLFFLLSLRSFLNVLPYLADSVLRARGSAALENSVKVSRDRNLVAAVLLIPAVLLIYRYRLYDSRFVQDFEPDFRLLAVAGVFLGYLLLRYLLSLWAKPRRRADEFQTAYRAGYTFFILLMMLALTTVGVLHIVGCEDMIIRTFLLIETATVYLLYLLRRAQILSGFCKPLTTFLYLCGLELLPTALLVLSALFL